MEAQKHTQDADEPGESLKQDTTQASIPAGNDGPSDAGPPNEKEETLKQAIPWWKDSQWWQVIVNAVLVPFGIYAVLVYSGQLAAMRESNGLLKASTDAATRAANSAENSVRQARESSRLDQRAWVAPRGISGHPEVGKKYTVILSVKNTGKTPAKNVRGIALGEMVPVGAPDPQDSLLSPENGALGVGLLPPNGEYTPEIAVSTDKVSTEALESMKTGALAVLIHGRIEYDDIFNCHHWVTFCLRAVTPELTAYITYKNYSKTDEDNCE